MALREVNLIPGEILERRGLVRHLLLWVCALLLLVVLILAANAYQMRTVAGKTETRQGTIKARAAALERMVGDIQKGQKELNLAHREQVQLAALIEQRRSYSSVLARLADAINDQTWLQQLALGAAQDQALHLSMTGFTHSHEHLGTFMLRLSGDPMFMRVVLKSAQEAKEGPAKSNPVQFQIDCDIAKETP